MTPFTSFFVRSECSVSDLLNQLRLRHQLGHVVLSRFSIKHYSRKSNQEIQDQPRSAQFCFNLAPWPVRCFSPKSGWPRDPPEQVGAAWARACLGFSSRSGPRKRNPERDLYVGFAGTGGLHRARGSNSGRAANRCKPLSRGPLSVRWGRGRGSRNAARSHRSAQLLGRSRGGRPGEIHVAVDTDVPLVPTFARARAAEGYERRNRDSQRCLAKKWTVKPTGDARDG